MAINKIIIYVFRTVKKGWQKYNLLLFLALFHKSVLQSRLIQQQKPIFSSQKLDESSLKSKKLNFVNGINWFGRLSITYFPLFPSFLCFQRQETEREQPAAPPEPIPEPVVNEPTAEEISAAAEKTADDEFNALLQEIDAVSQKETQKQEALKNVEDEQMANGSEEELVDYNVLFHSF